MRQIFISINVGYKFKEEAKFSKWGCRNKVIDVEEAKVNRQSYEHFVGNGLWFRFVLKKTNTYSMVNQCDWFIYCLILYPLETLFHLFFDFQLNDSLK